MDGVGRVADLRLTSDDQRIARALEYLEAHLDRPIRLADLARVAAVERKHFAVLFRRKTGRHCFDYFRERRLIHARKLLQGATVAEVAAAMGCHAWTLERAFRQAPAQRLAPIADDDSSRTNATRQ